MKRLPKWYESEGEMNRNKYFERARDLYDNDKISGDVYDAIAMNANQFCDDDDYDEIEYDDTKR